MRRSRSNRPTDNKSSCSLIGWFTEIRYHSCDHGRASGRAARSATADYVGANRVEEAPVLAQAARLVDAIYYSRCLLFPCLLLHSSTCELRLLMVYLVTEDNLMNSSSVGTVRTCGWPASSTARHWHIAVSLEGPCKPGDNQGWSNNAESRSRA
jgi:hypothetical protein